MNAVVDNIQKAVRVEILDVLEDADTRVRPSALVDRCESAADIDDIMTALRRLQSERLVVRHENGFALPAADVPPAQRAREAGPAEAQPRHLREQIASVLEHENAWLVVAEIQGRSAGLTPRQIVDTLRQCDRFVARQSNRAGVSGFEYGLATWAQTETAESKPANTNAPRKTGRLDRIVAAIRDAGSALTSHELAAALDEPLAKVQSSVSYGAGKSCGRLVIDGLDGQTRRYALAGEPEPEAMAKKPIPAEGEATPSAVPGRAPRYGLFSDGALAIESAAGVIDLEPEETRQLVEYLIGCRPQIAALFDEQLGGAS